MWFFTFTQKEKCGSTHSKENDKLILALNLKFKYLYLPFFLFFFPVFTAAEAGSMSSSSVN